MANSDNWDGVTDDDDEVVDTKTLKEKLMPRERYDMPIPERFLKTTKGLFYEHRHQTTVKDKAPYTLRNMDFTDAAGHLYRSMYMVYMQCDSEYEAAIELLGSYPHWKKLKRCSWFGDFVSAWEEERNIRDEAIARSILIRLAECGNVTAARTVFANVKDAKGKIGRPPKGGDRAEGVASSVLDEMLKAATSEGD